MHRFATVGAVGECPAAVATSSIFCFGVSKIHVSDTFMLLLLLDLLSWNYNLNRELGVS